MKNVIKSMDKTEKSYGSTSSKKISAAGGLKSAVTFTLGWTTKGILLIQDAGVETHKLLGDQEHNKVVNVVNSHYIDKIEASEKEIKIIKKKIKKASKKAVIKELNAELLMEQKALTYYEKKFSK